MYETQERAKRITDIHVLWGQSTVIGELIQAGKIDEEYIYHFNGEEVLEWWRHSVAGRTPPRAGRNHHRRIRVSLVGTADKRAGDLHGRRDTRNLRGGLTQLTTNKVSIPERNLLDRNFVFKNFAQLNTATAPERARCFAISAEYATFAVTY